MSKRTLLVAGAGLYVSIAGTTYVYLRGKQGSADAAGGFPAPQAPSSNGDGAQYDCIAPCYDKYIGWDETLMGVNLLRWWTLRRAKVRLIGTRLPGAKRARGHSQHTVQLLSSRVLRFFGPAGLCLTSIRTAPAGSLPRSLCWHRTKPAVL